MGTDQDLVHYEGYGSRPKSLRKHWVNCCARPDAETAEIDHLEDAVKEYPEFAEAWYLMGYCQQQEGDQEGAREAFERTISISKMHKGANFELARYELEAGRFQEATKYTRVLVEVEPNEPQVLYFDGVAQYNSGQLENALSSLNQLIATGSADVYPMTYFFLAVLEADRKNYGLAAEHLAKYLEVVPEEEIPEELRANAPLQLQIWREQAAQQEKRN